MSTLDELLQEAERVGRHSDVRFVTCEVCHTEVIHTICGCGDTADRFALTMQRRMRYLDITTLELRVAATKHLRGDRTPETADALRVALENWLDATEDV